ncbi:MAG: glycosyltransferase [Chloroflexi bacterium]|nr:glycosyltransferase [Chloroflexota bacterium]
MSNQLLSIILPVYNQADHIREIVTAYVQALSKIPNPYELLLVVNGCRDNSLEICNQLAEEFTSVRVVFSEKGGWGLAVKLGIQEAKGDLICYTNSARTSPQNLVLLLLYAVANPETVIKSNRKIRDNWKRRLGSLLYNLECRALFDLAYWDVNGTPKVFPRACNQLLGLTCDDDLIDAEFNAVCRREDYPMLEVPIFSFKRHSGRSTTSYKSAYRMYLGVYQLWRRMGRSKI